MRRWILYRVWHFRIVKGHLINSLQRVRMYLGSVSRNYFVCKQFQQSEFVFMRIRVSIVCNMKSRITIHISIDRFPCDETQRHMTPWRLGGGWLRMERGKRKIGRKKHETYAIAFSFSSECYFFFFFEIFILNRIR